MKHKDHYNDDYIFSLSQKILFVMPDFNENAFCHSLIGRLDDKELFARFDCIVDAMQTSMGGDYSKNIQAFFNMLGPELEQSEGMFNFGWWLWPIGRYVERYGNENWILSLAFLKELTKRFNEANNAEWSEKEVLQFGLTNMPNNEVLLKYIEYRIEDIEDDNKLRLTIKNFLKKHKKSTIKEE